VSKEFLIQVGPYSISTVRLGTVWLDGGGMFGPVPKPMWQKMISPDEKNRIPLATRSLLLESSDKRILIDVGCGTKWSPKLHEIYGFEYSDPTSIPQNVTDIILTHLHFDHAAGLSEWGEDPGSLHPVFPGARLHLQTKNYNLAKAPHPRERASYLDETNRSLSLYELNLIDGSTELFPGISVHCSDGHTKGQQYVVIADGQTTVIFPADVIPTVHHLRHTYHMGYDMWAEQLLEEKQTLLAMARAQKTIIVFEHDPVVRAVHAVGEKGDESDFHPFP